MFSQQNIRISLPSKGRLETGALDFLSAAGLQVFKPNPRQYQAEIPALPELGVIFQRPGDIVVSVRQGSVDFGITGLDVIEEKRRAEGVLSVWDRSPASLRMNDTRARDADPNVNIIIREPGHIEYASTLGLGVYDRAKIAVQNITL